MAAIRVILALIFVALAGTARAQQNRPNIVYILCDDLGYGDVQCLNPSRGKIATPHADKLFSEGMKFTDAHSSSAVCTPSRYSILTGRYAWRSRLQSGVLQGNSPPLIESGRLTVPQLLKQNGYTTACIGKWHLGLRFAESNFGGSIVDGPLQHGFDRYFGIAASLDMPPFAFIENDHFTEAPTATKKWVRSGPAAPSFEAADVVDELVKQSTNFIRENAPGASNGKPFFLYVALTSPHTPLVPTPAWKGKSSIGDYGDFVMETDDALGRILAAIDDAKLRDNTMVIFTSDNGCTPLIRIKEIEAKGHFASAQFRGYKSDIWEGGHRVPFVVRWPGVVKPGSTSSQMIGLIDLMATTAQMLGAKLSDHAGEDSFSILSALQGKDTSPLREAQINHSIRGDFSIRKGNWKLELCAGSGGWDAPREADALASHLPESQLYDMNSDETEQHNVAADHPEVVRELTALLDKFIAEGRSTPGAPQKNDAPIVIRKPARPTSAPSGLGE